ncbi:MULTISPECIES: hypothetical protein [Streptomyces]|uniref:hypothetical protein n=1 Tax=Streptomyces TaxID=1883 RepID=UPI00163BBDEE|nr:MULTISPECIES: hypothetical protein [Streptomyces]MBC2874219.1 hypothetical protein [Streptomyces sp. TYQ1024]UBI40260.1 hypothetical protein K7I03_29945 [Streptomyces mobaraensis]UKW32838.1 hypothetical protein MCU78_29870 [Streptomyces sp. TYQ1024]
MGIYVSIRGWLECDATQRAAVQEIIAAYDDDHYSHGWGSPRRQHGSWAHYVFYGADIRESALGWFTDQIGEIAGLPASDDDGDLVQGLFLVSHEVEGMTEWQVRDGRLHTAPADTGYRYLDA